MNKEKLRIVVLAPEMSVGKGLDDEAANDTILAASEIQKNLVEKGHRVERVNVTNNSFEQRLAGYEPFEWVVFNVCETFDGETTGEAEVARKLDNMGYAYTGSSAWALETALDKARTKQLLLAAGLPTARYQVFSTERDEVIVPFPAIVKPRSSDAGIGILAERSVVENDEQLRKAVRKILHEMHEIPLVEEFLHGREFNVAFLGNFPRQILPLAEIDFSGITDWRHKVVGFEAKWDKTSPYYHHTNAVCPAPVSLQLSHEISRVAQAACEVLQCRDYGRVDIRLNSEDVQYILEVNPNCGIAPDAGYPRQAYAAGYTYSEMLEQIAYLAAERLPDR